MTAEDIGRKLIKIGSGAVNYIVVILIALPITFAGYALWDSKQIHQSAGKANYAAYKPAADDAGKSFAELVAINAEVFAWISVYGTGIDYPVTQGPDNMKYVNTSAEGAYSLSGSIFLDCRNGKDFNDFNNILYGHHMAKKVMFGEIESFQDGGVFESRRYGNLYFDGKDHGIEFFAFVHTDAYDSSIFRTDVRGDKRREYLDGLYRKALNTRDIGLTEEDRIILLSTCSSSSTNGRDILAGRITDGTFADPAILVKADGAPSTDSDVFTGAAWSVPRWKIICVSAAALGFAALIPAAYLTRDKAGMKRKWRRDIWIGY